MPEIELWHWLAFAALVGVLLALDLLVFHRHARAPSLQESAGWSVFWIGLALVFNVVIDRFEYLHYGLSAVLIFIGAKMIAVDGTSRIHQGTINPGKFP